MCVSHFITNVPKKNVVKIEKREPSRSLPNRSHALVFCQSDSVTEHEQQAKENHDLYEMNYLIRNKSKFFLRIEAIAKKSKSIFTN